MWSKVRSFIFFLIPQYWHVHLSLKKTLNLVNAGSFFAETYSFKAITLGNLSENVGEFMTWSYSSTPVLLIHGEEDDIVPFSSLENAKKLLIGIGFNVKTVNRPGLGHGIDPDGISVGMDFVKKIINF